MSHLEHTRSALSDIRYLDWRFTAWERSGMVYIKADWLGPCNVTGKEERHITRRWLIRPEATRMEIVQTAFKLVLTALEHEAREKFAWCGRAVLGPHQDLDTLYHSAEVVPPYASPQ